MTATHACMQCGHCTKSRRGALAHKQLYCASCKCWRECGEVHELGTYELRSMHDLVRKHARCNIVPPRANEDGRIRKRGSVRGAYWAVMKKVFMDNPHNMSVRVALNDGQYCGADVRRKRVEPGLACAWYWERVDCETAALLVHQETVRLLTATLAELVRAQKQQRSAATNKRDLDDYVPPLAGYVDEQECAAQMSTVSQFGN